MTDLQRLLREVIVEIMREDKGQDAAAPAINAEQSVNPATSRAETHKRQEAVIEKGLLSERMVKSYANQGFKVLLLHKAVVVTPLAREAVRYLGMTIKKMERS